MKSYSTSSDQRFPALTMKDLRESLTALGGVPVETPQCMSRVTYGIYANEFGRTWCGALKRPTIPFGKPVAHYEPPCPWCTAAWYAYMHTLVRLG